ncbi:hypothetical protein G9P44_005886 [Scheffersomyces stipitis]|nr:hypothetical protein G9P44_005886 [Scheffersomyces stipitis]
MSTCQSYKIRIKIKDFVATSIRPPKTPQHPVCSTLVSHQVTSPQHNKMSPTTCPFRPGESPAKGFVSLPDDNLQMVL